ncbi:hypothetical protein MT355_20665 [Rathayibacter sp. VKM Ac-2929]|uniref:hypothetical protein n=1 Tax=Rathayibacter sp. VKM Ac-2929 TaxID=2929480 RepID=UPI001FB487BE|nr:hypothetical protein [Rathayibacter sp. VKM Ac-2929]MCJ1675687.1 hypothetical protein [Rathayibacter sp. VKM Ac-2929]
MTGPDASRDEYRAGYLAGQADRQGEIDALDFLADRLYRAAYGDERRLPTYASTRAELEQRRALSEPPVEVTRRDALASWGIEPALIDTPAADAAEEVPSTSTGRTNRTSRSLNEHVKASRLSFPWREAHDHPVDGERWNRSAARLG